MFCVAFLRSIFDEVNTMDFVIEKIMVGSSVFTYTVFFQLARLLNLLFQQQDERRSATTYYLSKTSSMFFYREEFPLPLPDISTQKYLIGSYSNIFYFRLSPKGLLMPIDARCLWWTPDQMNYTRICLMKETKMEPDSNSGAEWK